MTDANMSLSSEDEDLIEEVFWNFDAERKRTGAERDAFKGQMRAMLRRERSKRERGEK